MLKLIWSLLLVMFAPAKEDKCSERISEKLSYQDVVHNKRAANIQEIIKSAYLNSPDIKAALAKKRAKDEDIALAFSEFYPSIYAKYSCGFRRQKKDKDLSTNVNSLNSERIFEQDVFSTIALGYEQNIFGMSSIEKVKQMKFESEAARFSFYNTVQQVIRYTAETFINLWAAYETFKSYDLMEKNLKQILDSYTAQINVGILKIQDLESIRSSYAESVFKKISSLAEIQSQIAILKRFSGENSDILPILSDIFYNIPKTKEELLSCVEHDNPAVISAKNSHLAKEQESIAVTRQTTYSIDLKAQLARNLKHKSKNKNYFLGKVDNVINSSKNDTSYVNVAITVPLSPNPSGNNGYATIRKVQEETIQAYFNYINTLNKAKKDVESEWNNFNAATKQIESSRIAVKSAEIAEEGYKKEESIGTRSSTEVVYNENKLLERRIQYIDSIKKRAITAIRLNSYLGRLSPSKLNIKVPSYNLKYGEKFIERAPFKTTNPIYNSK